MRLQSGSGKLKVCRYFTMFNNIKVVHSLDPGGDAELLCKLCTTFVYRKQVLNGYGSVPVKFSINLTSVLILVPCILPRQSGIYIHVPKRILVI